MNFEQPTTWRYDASTKLMIQDLKENIEKSNLKTPVSMSINWVLEPAINFYRVSQNLSWLTRVNRKGFDISSDYYYVLDDDADFLNKNHKLIVKRYPVSKTILAKQ